MRTKKIAAAVLAAAAALSLAACSDGTAVQTGTGGTSSELYEHSIVLEDGRDVTCIVFKGYQKGGLSCDWQGATS